MVRSIPGRRAQNRAEVFRCPMQDTEALFKLLSLFFDHERPEIAEFRKAVSEFRTYLPRVLDTLRRQIEAAYRDNASFGEAAAGFLQHAKDITGAMRSARRE